RNVAAATTVVVAALASRAAHAGERISDIVPAPYRGGHCYLRGTAIRTSSGEREIGELQIGDSVVTHSGKTKPIKWIGRRRLQRDGNWPADVMPVKLLPSALDDDIPLRELFVSRWHAIYLDEQLIPAGSLVNGRTIVVPRAMPKVLEYLDIELFEH